MAAFLLDVNVLIALAWPTHTSHETVQRWFAKNARHGWATCPLTESGFVRILSNPAFSSNSLNPLEALGLLKANKQHHAHRFFPDDISFADAVKKFERRLVGHRQVTDAYLLGLALHHRSTLATLDSGLTSLARETSDHVELIR